MNDKTINVIKIFCKSLTISLLRGILLVAGIVLLIACGKPGQSGDPTAEYEALKADIPPGTEKVQQFYLGAPYIVSHPDSAKVTYRFTEGKESRYTFVVNNFTPSNDISVKVKDDSLSPEQKKWVQQITLKKLSENGKSQRWELEWTPGQGFIPENAIFRDLAISLWIGSENSALNNFIEEPIDLFVTKPEDDLSVTFVDLNNDTTIQCNSQNIISFRVEVSSRSGGLSTSPVLQFLSFPNSSTSRSGESPIDLSKYVSRERITKESNRKYIYNYKLEIREYDVLLNNKTGSLTVQASGRGVNGVSFTVLPKISCPPTTPPPKNK